MTSPRAAAAGDGQAVLDPRRVTILKELATSADLRELTATFAADAVAAVGAMRVAVAANDRCNVVDVAHRLWGGCVTIGATRLATLLRDIEHRVAETGLEPRDVPIEVIRAEADTAIAALGEAFSGA